MVKIEEPDWQTIRAMQDLSEKNEGKYIREHPGEVVLITGTHNKLKESFYITVHEAHKHGGRGEFYIEKIPLERTEEEGVFRGIKGIAVSSIFSDVEKDSVTLDYFVDRCPNYISTKLAVRHPIQEDVDDDGNATYTQLSECPICDCRVYHPLTDKTIREIEKTKRRWDNIEIRASEPGYRISP